jgi:predicted MFS family arabinose efflux permease
MRFYIFSFAIIPLFKLSLHLVLSSTACYNNFILMTKKEKLILFVLAAAQFTHIVDFMIMMPLGPQLMRIFKINPQQFSLIVASYTFSAGIFGFLGAFVIDRFDRKTAFIIAYIGFTLGTLACGLATTYHFLLAARILAGAFGGILGALVLAIISDIIPLERRASAMGIVMTAFSAASVLGVPIGLWLANLYTWNAPFLFLAGFTTLITASIFKIIPSLTEHLQSKTNRPKPFDVITNVTRDKNALRALLMMSLLIFGQFSVIPFLSPYMVYNVGFQESELPFIYLCGGIGTIFTLPLIGKLADKHGRLKIFGYAIFLSVIPILVITNLGHISVYSALIITTFFMILVGGRIVPATTMVTSTVHPKNRGSFMSINSSIQQLSSGTASFLAGMVILKNADGSLSHYNWIGFFAIAASLLSLYVAQKLRSADGQKL